MLSKVKELLLREEIPPQRKLLPVQTQDLGWNHKLMDAMVF